MSMRTVFSALLAMVVTFCGELRADTIIQDSGGAGVTIAFFDPIGQSFLWTTDAGLGTIGFAFNNASFTSPNDPVTVQLYTGVGFGGTLLASVTQVLPVNLPIPMDPGPPIDFDFSGIARAGSWLVYGGGHDIKQSQDWFKARD